MVEVLKNRNRIILTLIILNVITLIIIRVNFQNYDYSLDNVIERYIPTMSSVPGLPLKITCENENLNLEMKIEASSGNLLFWKTDIENLGSNFKTSFANKTIYFTPIYEMNEEEIIVKITVYNIKKDEVVSIRNFKIEKDDKEFYRFKGEIISE
ncbi:hypothetical protein QUF55_04535 [Clostridiaceae bacterium HSG29]|nr:hypothetical protein [Clostridiaceae bacterium HSG29]